MTSPPKDMGYEECFIVVLPHHACFGFAYREDLTASTTDWISSSVR